MCALLNNFYFYACNSSTVRTVPIDMCEPYLPPGAELTTPMASAAATTRRRHYGCRRREDPGVGRVWRRRGVGGVLPMRRALAAGLVAGV